MTTDRTSLPAPQAAATPGRLLRRCACGQHSGGGECAECKKKRLGRSLERSAVSAEAPEVAPPSVHQPLVAGGRPLDGATRTHFERGFGRDFSHVRVHSDARAAESAREVSAQAYTVGSHLAFGAGQYQPQSPEGRRLLGHELAHVAQQEGAPASGEIRIGRTDSPAEREAESAAGALEGGRTPTLRRSAPELARMPESEASADEAAEEIEEPISLGEEAATDTEEVQDGDSPMAGGSGLAIEEDDETPDAIAEEMAAAGGEASPFLPAAHHETPSGPAASGVKTTPVKPTAKPGAKEAKKPPAKPKPKKPKCAPCGAGKPAKEGGKKPFIEKIDVDLDSQSMTLTWSDGSTDGPWDVSTGRGLADTAGDPCPAGKTGKDTLCTPTGTFEVSAAKDCTHKNGKGDAMAWYVELYGNDQVNNRGIGIHNSQVVRKGRPLSHGCIRTGTTSDQGYKRACTIAKNIKPGTTKVTISGKAPTKAYESPEGRKKRLAAEKKKKEEAAKKKAAGSKTAPKKGAKPPAQKGKK